MFQISAKNATSGQLVYAWSNRRQGLMHTTAEVHDNPGDWRIVRVHGVSERGLITDVGVYPANMTIVVY